MPRLVKLGFAMMSDFGDNEFRGLSQEVSRFSNAGSSLCGDPDRGGGDGDGHPDAQRLHHGERRGLRQPHGSGFSGTPLTGTTPLTVTFTDIASSRHDLRVVVELWGRGSSSETNPGHGYTQTGVYSVSLTVSGACGSDVLTRTSYITVSSGYTATSTTITYTYDSLNRLT